LRELLSAGFGAGAGAGAGGGGGGGEREAAPVPPPAGAAAGGGRPSKRSSEAMDVWVLFGLAGSETREKRRVNYGPWIWIAAAAAGIKQGPAQIRLRMGLLPSIIPPIRSPCLLKRATFLCVPTGIVDSI